MIKLLAMLDKAGSRKQINSDIKALQGTLSKLRLTATLAKGESKKNLNQIVRQMEGQLNKIRLQAKFDQKNLKSDINKALNNVSFKDIGVNIDSGKTKLKVQKAISDAKRVIQNNPLTLDIGLKKQKLNNQLTAYISKNSKIRESQGLLSQVDALRNKISGINDNDSLRRATQEFQLFRSECAATGYQSTSTSEKIKNLVSGATRLGSVLGVTSLAVRNFSKSLKTIRENDTIITEINKTSNMVKSQLEEIGNQSFDVGSKFGRLSGDYLLGVQEMARAGYEETSKELAELSLLAQSAGDMTAETANNYILATDKAYKYGGSVEALNAVLDGCNYISNNNAVALNDIAEGMSKAGAFASSYRVSIEDLSAMIGTMEAVTKTGGDEVGNAAKAILINLQNVTSDKIVQTLQQANASMTEMVGGTKKLREPIAILRDLAKTFNQLDEDDPLRAKILTNIGQKYHANKLSALLQNMDMFDKMLVDYSEGEGSALEEANFASLYRNMQLEHI